MTYRFSFSKAILYHLLLLAGILAARANQNSLIDQYNAHPAPPLPQNNATTAQPNDPDLQAKLKGLTPTAPTAYPEAGKVVDITAAGDNGHGATQGEPVSVTIGGRVFGLEPNPLGLYPRLSVLSQTTLVVHISSTPGEEVRLISIDGGRVDNQQRAARLKADAQGGSVFNFHLPDAPGLHRLLLFRSGRKETLSFWVGSPLVMRHGLMNN